MHTTGRDGSARVTLIVTDNGLVVDQLISAQLALHVAAAQPLRAPRSRSPRRPAATSTVRPIATPAAGPARQALPPVAGGGTFDHRRGFGWPVGRIRSTRTGTIGLLTTVETVRNERDSEGNQLSELRLMAVHAHPDDESSKGAATTARYAAEGARVHGGDADRRRARRHPQPGDGPARGARPDRRDPARRDGQGRRDPRRRASLAGLRRLRAARGRPAAAAARGLLRAGAAGGADRARW